MALVKKTDDQGNTMIFKWYQDRSFSKYTLGNVHDQLGKVANLQCRSDDVLICTFPKSGTHWVFNMARMIQTKNLQYSGSPEIMEFQDIGVIDQMKSPRMFHTHLSYPFIPKGAMEGQLKMIYVLRNPKDIACSFNAFQYKLSNPSYTGTFDGFLMFYLSEEFFASGGSWFTHTTEWNNAMLTNPDLKILFLRFEDLKKNLYQNILRIANFLEVDHEETFFKKVEQAVSFENLKKEHATSADDFERWKHTADHGRLPVYRKGVVGDWKNEFTVAQNEKFDDVYKTKMGDMAFNLEFDFD